jgi:tripartite-type tricarboxylate transporter receptor subunit TctC
MMQRQRSMWTKVGPLDRSRRGLIRLAVGGCAAAALPHRAWPQQYPTHPVRWILGYTTGGTTDIVSRVITQPLSERLGQSFVIEPRPGAGTNLATQFVVRAALDGYTLLFVGAPNAINASLYSKLNFDFVRDIAPIIGLVRVPMVLIVHPSVPATTVAELLAYAKTHPKAINMASSGIGTTPHLAGELFRMMTGADIQHVPYRGAAPAITDLLAGQVQLYFATTPVSIEHIRTGRLRGLAVTTVERLEQLPNLPTIGEFVKDFEASAWYGLGAPKDTPQPIIEKLNREINAVLADSKIKATLADLGCVPIGGTAAAFRGLIVDETEKWGKVVRSANIRAG